MFNNDPGLGGLMLAGTSCRYSGPPAFCRKQRRFYGGSEYTQAKIVMVSKK